MSAKSKGFPELPDKKGEFLQIEATEFEFKELVIVNGCSEKVSHEIWKWYTQPQFGKTHTPETRQ